MKLLKKISIIFVVILMLVLLDISSFAFGFYDSLQTILNQTGINIGEFDYSSGEEYEADVIIDDVFHNTYMEQDENGTWDWALDENGNIENIAEIKSLTPIGTIIKTDIYYYVKSGFNLIDHGIPSLDNTTAYWALMPLCEDFLEGWVYLQNHVVKATDGNYYMAKWYSTVNPMTNRSTWNKIEPVTADDFNKIEDTNFVDYSSPIISHIQRSYIWDSYTTYIIGDIVIYNQIEYRNKQSNTNVIPLNNTWAWTKI